MKLADLQRDFQRWLVHAAPDAARRLGPAAGLAVYQNNYRGQLVACLEHSYPQLQRWIGAEEFHRAAVRHIDACPPHAWTLDAYADGFHTTLAAHFPRNPDLHELAWIEHALSAAFVAADAAPLQLAALADIDWESARLALTPSLRHRPATTNAQAIWDAVWEGVEAPQGEMLSEPGGYIVWRKGLQSMLRQLDALEYEALCHLQQHGSFAAMCELLAGRLGEEDGVARAGALLAQWISNELITQQGTRT